MTRRTRFREDKLGRRVYPYRIGGKNYTLEDSYRKKSSAKARARGIRGTGRYLARVVKRRTPRGARRTEWRVVIRSKR